jgi:hypothetical protein
MKLMFGIMAAVGMLCSSAAWAQESNDSPEKLASAEAQVQAKLGQFATNRVDYQLLLDAQKIATSINPRGGMTNLSKLDENCLRLQLKVLLALAAARDTNYDRNAKTNAVYLNVMPPLAKKPGQVYASGMSPEAIKDPEERKAYEDAIAENHRRSEKLKREMAISRGGEYALNNIWIFINWGYPKDSAARKSAIALVNATLTDKEMLKRFNSDTSPGLTW